MSIFPTSVGNTHDRVDMGEDFPLVGNGDGEFKYSFVKLGEGWDYDHRTHGYLI